MQLYFIVVFGTSSTLLQLLRKSYGVSEAFEDCISGPRQLRLLWYELNIPDISIQHLLLVPPHLFLSIPSTTHLWLKHLRRARCFPHHGLDIGCPFLENKGFGIETARNQRSSQERRHVVLVQRDLPRMERKNQVILAKIFIHRASPFFQFIVPHPYEYK